MNTTLNFKSIFQLHQSGKLQEALSAYQRFLKQDPQHVDALTALASLYLQLGQLQDSAQLFEQALELQPRKLLALHNYALCLKRQKRDEQALEQFNLALAVDPYYELAYKNKFALLANMGRHAERLSCLLQSVQQLPHSSDLALMLVASLREQKQLTEALQQIERLLELKPDLVGAHNTRGNILLELGREADAVGAYQTAIRLQPDYAKAHSNLAISYLSLAQYQSALDSFDRALALDPELPGVRNNRANALQSLHRFDDAIRAYEEIMTLDPRDSIAAANKGMLNLLLGNFKLGWPLYEARWQNAAVSVHQELLAYPLWNGSDSLQGKILILHPEQGFGDTLQFCRYARVLAAQAAQVYLVVNQALYSLLQHSVARWPAAQNISVISAGAKIPEFHCQLPLLSAPRVLKTDMHSIPDFGTYLFADPHSMEFWKARLGQSERIRIGLVWSGSDKHSNDRNRSLPLAELGEVLCRELCPSNQESANVEFEFHALQKEIKTEDLALLSTLQIQNHTQDLHSFNDTAGLISHMDVVISVDTSVAHLAAGMGKPTWILLPHVPDFRWLLGREDSPWYRSVRLFRQQKARDWRTPLDQVVQACRQLYLQSNPTSTLSVDATNNPSNLPASRMNDANLLIQQGNWDEAEKILRQEKLLRDGDAKLHNNWGVVLQKLGRFDEALAAYSRSISLEPSYVSPHLNKAICLLSLGHFTEGWKLYEWRWKNEQWNSSLRQFSQPLWLGEQNIAGKRILIYAEQGLGDTLQFCRLLSRIKALGATVFFEVPESLISLLRSLPVEVFATGTAPHEVDFQCPLLSLPLALELSMQDIPQEVPYLGVNSDKQLEWQQKISDSRFANSIQVRTKVGVVWAGSSRHGNDAQRSIPLAIFSKLMQDDADYYVLQKEISRSDRISLEMLQRFGKRIHIVDAELTDFSDTAALINCLDVVVSVDTSVAHLAGALAKPALLLLAYESDFRWLRNRQDSPWYPSVALYRQAQPGDWASALTPLHTALKAMLKRSR